MITAFEDPVLDIAVDAVNKVESALGLWTVFTKCKESLKDGRRLENIAWRAYHAEFAQWRDAKLASQTQQQESQVSAPLPPLSSESESEDDDDSAWESASSAHDAKPAPARPTPQRQNTATSTTAKVRSSRPQSRRPSPASTTRRSASKRRLASHSRPVAPGEPAERVSASHPGPAVTRPLLDSHRANSAPTCQVRDRQLLKAPLNIGKIISTILPAVVVSPVRNPSRSPSAEAQQRTQLDPMASTASAPVPEVKSVVVVHATPSALPPPAPSVIISNPTPRPTPPLSPSTSRVPVAPVPSAQPTKLAAPALPINRSPSPNEEARKKKFYVEEPHSAGKDGAGGSSASSASKPAIKSRKGKEPARAPPKVMAYRQPTLHRPHHGLLNHAKTAKDLKLVGSVSSNGSKTSSKKASTAAAQPPPPPPPRQPAKKPPTRPPSPAPVQRRRPVEVADSSDFDTDSEEESCWSSDEEEDPVAANNDIARRAALEAARQRDLFTKIPTRSYSNLAAKNTSSGLTALFNPPANVLPLDHPYRRTASAADIAYRPPPQSQHLQMSKSTAALPLAAQVQATVQPQVQAPLNAHGRPGNRLGAKPQNVEVDTETEDEKNAELSKSAAERQLAALAGKHQVSKKNQSQQHVPTQEKNNSKARPQPAPQQPAPQPPTSQSHPEQSAAMPPSPPALTRVATAPIALPHPYNLPAPAPPQTPRTTRRQMLSKELSESLRRNLLWERAISKQVMGVAQPRRQVGLLGDGLRPLSTLNSANNENKDSKATSRSGDEADRPPKAKAPLPRNRTFSSDYHDWGW